MADSGPNGESPSTHLVPSRSGQSPRTRTVSTTDRSDTSGREAATGFAGRVESHPTQQTSSLSYVARDLLFKIVARRRTHSPPAGHNIIQLASTRPPEPRIPDRAKRLPFVTALRRPNLTPAGRSHTTATLPREGGVESDFDTPRFRCAWSQSCRTEPPRADRPLPGERVGVTTKTVPPGVLSQIRCRAVVAYSAGGAEFRDRSTV